MLGKLFRYACAVVMLAIMALIAWDKVIGGFYMPHLGTLRCRAGEVDIGLEVRQAAGGVGRRRTACR